MSLARALRLAGDAAGRAYPKPTVGAVVVRDGEVVGEGATEAGGRHAEVVALAAAGERARGATPVRDARAVLALGHDAALHGRAARAPASRGSWSACATPIPRRPAVSRRCAPAGVEVELVDSWEARVQNEAWRTWVSAGRPFVTYKAAVSLDGRVVVPGRRWVSGEASRRLVHELRAGVDAVAVGMGTVRADAPRLDARDVPTPRGQPRRLAFGRGPLPPGSELELRTGALADELAALAAEGVQSLLLEGGPTLAGAFLEADLVDKLLVFTAPVLAGGDGSTLLARLASPRPLIHLGVRMVGEDALLEAYVREP